MRQACRDVSTVEGAWMVEDAAFVAVDLGAESGRVLLGRFDGNRVRLADLSRFPHRPISIFPMRRSASSCPSGSTMSPHKDRPRSSRAANSSSVTRPIVRSSNIRLTRRPFGGWRRRRRPRACPMAVPRRSVTNQSASRPPPRRPNSSSRPLLSSAALLARGGADTLYEHALYEHSVRTPIVKPQ